MGSEHIRMTYRHEDFSISAYLENYYDDFSGMGKLNGFDGLWGIEYKSNHKQAINGFVLNTIRLLIRAVQCMEWISP